MIRRLLFTLSFLTVIMSCGKKNSPKPPEAAQLLFPEQNSECTTGIDLDPTTSRVQFTWTAAENTDSYELRVTNTETSITQTTGTTGTAASLPLTKGAQFTWLVRSKNNQTDVVVSSENWSFYNAGFRTTFAPFPATIISPTSAENVFRDINNEVMLSWSSSDLDNDIQNFEVYLSETNPPLNLVSTLNNNTTSIDVSVNPDTVYYWSVITIDSEENKSNSGIYSFKVL